MRKQIRSHTELEVYRKAFEAAMHMYQTYDEVLSILVDMIRHAEQWILPPR